MANHDRHEALLEEIRRKTKTILAMLTSMQQNLDRLPKIEQDIQNIRADLRATISALKN